MVQQAHSQAGVQVETDVTEPVQFPVADFKQQLITSYTQFGVQVAVVVKQPAQSVAAEDKHKHT